VQGDKMKYEFTAIVQPITPPSSCVSYPQIFAFDSLDQLNAFLNATPASKKTEALPAQYVFMGWNHADNNYF